MNWDAAFYVQDGQIISGPRMLPRRWFDRSLWDKSPEERIALGWLPSNLVTGCGYTSATVYADRVECVMVASVLDELKAAKYAAVTAKRIAVAEGGLTFGGVFIPTDKEAVVIINAARESFKRTPGRPAVHRAGIGTLNGAALDLLFDAIDNLWTAAFDHEAYLYDTIEAAETVEELYAIDIDEGWK